MSNPTESQVYAAYQSVLDTLNAQCEATTDKDAILALNAAAQAVSDIMTGENEVHLEANEGEFTTMTPGMRTANDALKKLKDQIAAIVSKFGDASKVLSAINQVLVLTGKCM